MCTCTAFERRYLDPSSYDCAPVCDETGCSDTCVTYCAPMCRTEMLGDSICDSSCDNADCHYDGGDCGPETDSLYRTITIVGFCLIASVFVW